MKEKPPLESFLTKSPLQKEDLKSNDLGAKFFELLKGKDGEKGETVTGPQGPQGPRGFSGTDGETPSKEVLVELIKPLIPPKAKDGRDGIDGITPTKDELFELIQPLIPAVKDGKDGSPDTPEDVVKKVNKAKGKIKASKIEGFDEIEGLARSANRNVQNISSLGGTRQTAIKVSGTLLGTGITTLNFVGATGQAVGDGSEANITTSSGTNLSLTTTGTSGPATYNNGTGVLNIPIYSAGSGGISRSISTVSTTTAAGAAASTDYVYLCSGTFTITLPATTGNTNLYTIKNIGSGVITVATTGGETIDGSATASIPVQWTSYDFVAASGNWNVV